MGVTPEVCEMLEDGQPTKQIMTDECVGNTAISTDKRE